MGAESAVREGTARGRKGGAEGRKGCRGFKFIVWCFFGFFFAFFPRQASPFDANGAGMHRLTRVGEPQSLR